MLILLKILIRSQFIEVHTYMHVCYSLHYTFIKKFMFQSCFIICLKHQFIKSQKNE